MLKDEVKQYISEQESNPKNEEAALFKEEKEFAEKYQLVESRHFVERNPSERFADAYIERCDKQTENMIKLESSQFLTQPLDYLKKNKNEFIYLESKWLDVVRVDAISLEVDDVFGTYDVMLGLKLQKKAGNKMKEYLNRHLHGEEAKFDLLFNAEEGLWNLNFALDYVEGVNETMSIGEGFQLIYGFLFKLEEAMEQAE